MSAVAIPGVKKADLFVMIDGSDQRVEEKLEMALNEFPLASSSKHVDFDLDKILQDSKNVRLFEAMERFAQRVRKLGYPVETHSELSLKKVILASEEAKLKLASDFESWSEWIEPLDPTTPSENHLNLLMRALAKHGYEVDDEFIKTIKHDQIVEFYNEDMIQLYRSINFFEISGYTLLDMSVFEWFVLWDRPKQIRKKIAEELNESLKTYIPVKRFLTPRHVIREIYDTSNSKAFVPRVSLAEFLHLGSLRPSRFSGNSKKGFICTSYGQLLAVGEEAKTIQCI